MLQFNCNIEFLSNYFLVVSCSYLKQLNKTFFSIYSKSYSIILRNWNIETACLSQQCKFSSKSSNKFLVFFNTLLFFDYQVFLNSPFYTLYCIKRSYPKSNLAAFNQLSPKTVKAPMIWMLTYLCMF